MASDGYDCRTCGEAHAGFLRIKGSRGPFVERIGESMPM